jgi:hypothetical protein
MIMLGADKITTVLKLGLFAFGLMAMSSHQAQAQTLDGLSVIPGEGFGSGVYIDGRTPIDKATRDKVDAYLEGYKRRQDTRKEYFDRMKNHQYHDLISRGRPVGRY